MSLASRISGYNRKRKYSYFLNEIKPQPENTLLDVGFASVEYSDVDNFLEREYPYRENITALGIDGDGKFKEKYPEIKVVLYDGNIFPFNDNTFDIGWSNAVIEHVGSREKQVLFVKELLRTCEKVYLTTPNRLFPVELHTRVLFLHWLPKALFDKILNLIGLNWAAGDYMYLLTKKKIKSICKSAGAKTIKIKSNRLLGFSMDYSIIVSK